MASASIAHSESTAVGRVASVNPKGVKLDGETDWRNFSRFADDIVPPMRGQTVTLTLDRQGFVRAVDAADGAEVTHTGRQAPGIITARETAITRLAVLKAAAEYAASKPESKSTDVLKIAASWERWVNRPEGDDLVDAF